MVKEIIFQITKEGSKITEDNPLFFIEERNILKVLQKEPSNIFQLSKKLNTDSQLKYTWYNINMTLMKLEEKKLVEKRK